MTTAPHKTPLHDRYIYGLDFGTSNTGIAIYDTHTHTIINTVEIEPTLLYYPHQDRLLTAFVGAAATARYIADGMTGRFFQAIKTAIPEASFTHTTVNGIKLTPVDLLATIIGYFKNKADALVGHSVTSVVCGRPANYGKGQKAEALALERMTAALKKVGFTNIQFQLEPIAAALDYETHLQKPQTVLVGDFGGGTSDYTLIRLDPAKVGQHDRSGDIIATAGVAVAGNKFDSALMRERLLPHFGSRATYAIHKNAQRLSAANYAHAGLIEWDKIHHLKSDKKIMEHLQHMIVFSDDPNAFRRMKTLIEQNLGFALFRQIEACKIALTTQTQAPINFEHPQLSIHEPVLAADFQTFTHDETATIIDCCHTLLTTHHITPQAIDAVFLTGGSAQLPALREYFNKTFGHAKVHTTDFFASVCRGLALSGI